MYIVVLAWLYVALMMGVVEAFSSQGSVLGGLITFALYGALPIVLVIYIGGSHARRHARSRAGAPDSIAADPDGGSHPAGHPVPPEREEP